jgi:hypothetical protein
MAVILSIDHHMNTNNRKMNVGMTDRYEDMEVHCQGTVYSHAFAMFRDGQYFSTTNGGADTCILGHGWRFVQFYLHCSVNIVGYQEAHTQHKGCGIGKA